MRTNSICAAILASIILLSPAQVAYAQVQPAAEITISVATIPGPVSATTIPATGYIEHSASAA